MGSQSWDFDSTEIDLEDLDVTVRLVHPNALTIVTVEFRMDASALSTSAAELKGRAEKIARSILRGLAASMKDRDPQAPAG